MRHNTEPGGDYIHIPVMGKEIKDYIAGIRDSGGKYLVDCTLGEGGHSELILKNFPDLKVIGFERDGEILKIAKKRLDPFGNRVQLIQGNFKDISLHLTGYRGLVCCFLYDFGISSFHFDRSERGFSLYKDEKLDMRLDRENDNSAYRIVNYYSEKELVNIFSSYGEERYSKRIARRICEKRQGNKIKTSSELADVILGAVPGGKRPGKGIHPATRVFQAIRIAVNDELQAIKESLEDAGGYLAQDGIIIAISYHSLEDRIVKNSFKRMKLGCTCSLPGKDCMCTREPTVRILTKKPISPGPDEIFSNRRARSAKLRVCEKL